MNDIKTKNIPYKIKSELCSYSLTSNTSYLFMGRKSTNKEIIYPSGKKSAPVKTGNKIIQKNYSEEKDTSPFPPKNYILSGRKFVALEEHIKIDVKGIKSSKINTSELFTFTFFIQNLGENPVEINLQISPDNKKWLDDGLDITVGSADTITLVSNTFAKYTRLSLKTSKGKTEVKIWFQGQV